MTMAQRSVLLLSSLCFLVNGCARPVCNTGVVSFDDGQYVRSGSIEFRSLSDQGRFASRIDGQGGFALLNQAGEPACPPGEYEVVVVQIVLTEDLAASAHSHGRTVPRRFADYYTSGLRVSVPAQPLPALQVRLPLLPSDR